RSDVNGASARRDPTASSRSAAMPRGRVGAGRRRSAGGRPARPGGRATWTPPAATVRISPPRHHPGPAVSGREGFAMTKDGEEFVVLQDQEGRYYLLPRRTLEVARVAKESVEKLRALMEGDVTGYAIAAQIFSQRAIIVVGGRAGVGLSGINSDSAF